MAGGRPAGPQFIVPPPEILTPAAIVAEEWRLGQLYQELRTSQLAIQWAACHQQNSTIHVNQCVVKPVTVVRDLGLWFDAELSMRSHVS